MEHEKAQNVSKESALKIQLLLAWLRHAEDTGEWAQERNRKSDDSDCERETSCRSTADQAIEIGAEERGDSYQERDQGMFSCPLGEQKESISHSLYVGKLPATGESLYQTAKTGTMQPQPPLVRVTIVQDPDCALLSNRRL
jgi:hypothetical protein